MAGELSRSERKLSTITHAARDAIIMMDTYGRVSFWNPGAEQIFGYAARRPWDGTCTAWWRLNATGRPTRGPFPVSG